MNVRINLGGLKDEKAEIALQQQMEKLVAESKRVPISARDSVEKQV